jgi:hypothetical protein
MFSHDIVLSYLLTLLVNLHGPPKKVLLWKNADNIIYLVNMVMFGNYFVNIVRNPSNLSISMVLKKLNENGTNIKVCFII